MPFNLLLLPLIGGFVLLTHWNYTKYFAERLDKERLLFYASLAGLILISLSFGSSILIASYPTWPGFFYLMRLRDWWAWNTPPLEFSGVSVFAFLLGALSPPILNRRPFAILWDKHKMSDEAIERFGSVLENLLLKALRDNKTVMVTLTSGKVYIGRLTSIPAPGDNRSFELVPLKSGYRDASTHRLELTTHYDDAYDLMLSGEPDPSVSIGDFGIVIPVKNVLTATLFRPDLYSKYFPRKTLID